MVAACWPLTPVEQEPDFSDREVVRDFLLMILESWWPPTLLLSANHSAFPFSTFTRWLGGVVSLRCQAKKLGKGRAHRDGFDACEIRALFWTKQAFSCEVWRSLADLQGCHEINLVEFFSFDLSICFS